MYSHVTFASDDGRFNALENKLSKRIAALEIQLKDNMEKLLSEKENQEDSLRKDLNEKIHKLMP